MDVSGRPSVGKKETQCTLTPMLISDMTRKKPPGSPPQNKTPYKDLRIAGRVGRCCTENKHHSCKGRNRSTTDRKEGGDVVETVQEELF